MKNMNSNKTIYNILKCPAGQHEYLQEGRTKTILCTQDNWTMKTGSEPLNAALEM